jgi:hypothetical protein
MVSAMSFYLHPNRADRQTAIQHKSKHKKTQPFRKHAKADAASLNIGFAAI